MKGIMRIGAVLTFMATVAGCGGEDYSGAYVAEGAWGKQIVLNVDGSNATLFIRDKGNAQITLVEDLKVDYSKDKMFIDEKPPRSARFVFARDIDERSLVCLNCAELNSKLPKKWALANAKPYDVAAMLAEQRKAEAKAEQERQQRLAEMAKLAPFAGDWVGHRDFKDDSLLIMTIDAHKGVKHWAFNYASASKLIELNRNFSVAEGELLLGAKDDAQSFKLSADGQQLQCTNCKKPWYWSKADPVKVNQIGYTRSLAGNPQTAR